MNMTMKIGLSPLALLVMLVSTISFHATVARADRDNKSGKALPFTEVSFEGTYAGYALFSGGGAAGNLVILTFDRTGTFSGTSIWNIEGELIDPINIEGTYTVSPEGVVNLTGGGGSGPLGDREFVMVITRSRKIKGRRVALEIAILSSGLGPTGNVLTAILTKQSEELATEDD